MDVWNHKADKIRNEINIGTTKVREISKKAHKRRLNSNRCVGVMRKEGMIIVLLDIVMDDNGRMKGRVKWKWMGSIKVGLREKGKNFTPNISFAFSKISLDDNFCNSIFFTNVEINVIKYIWKCKMIISHLFLALFRC